MARKRTEDKSRSTFTSETTPTEGRPGFEDTVVTTTTTTTDPIEVAHGLTRSFQENTDALRQVKNRVRNLRVLMVLVMLSLALGGWSLWRVDQAQEKACEAGNNVRGGLLHVADTLEAAQQEPRPDGRERTPAEVEAAEQFISDLRDDFALRRC